MKKDIFDRVTIEDVFDRIDLAVEDKVIYSPEMKELLLEEIRKEIGKIPVGKLIAALMEKEVSRQSKEADALRTSFNKELEKARSEAQNEIAKIREEEKHIRKDMKDKYDELRSNLMNTYTFGGFSPQFNDLNIGDPATEGSWRIVRSGNDLVIQRLESSSWVEKGAFVS